MYRTGIDIIEIDRIREAIERWGPRFLERIYTRAELDYCRDRIPELSARFAGKEAVMKALGTGRSGISWREIEIISDRRKAPAIILHGRARARARRLKIQELAISLSHSRDYAIASVIGGTP